MAAPKKLPKKIADVQVGDSYTVTKVVTGKAEDLTSITLSFDDGTTMNFLKEGDPALEMDA